MSRTGRNGKHLLNVFWKNALHAISSPNAKTRNSRIDDTLNSTGTNDPALTVSYLIYSGKNDIENSTQTASTIKGNISQIQIFLSVKLVPIAFRSRPLPFIGCLVITLLIKKKMIPIMIAADDR